MRYYDIIVTDPNGEQIAEWTSYPNGVPDPNALQVEFDIQSGPAGSVSNAGGSVTIYGVPLQMLQQAQTWTGTAADPKHPAFYVLTLIGGMGGGLPLENPQQRGVIVKASIVAAMGNWVGTEQTLTFLLQGDGYSTKHPGNFVLNWRKGTDLAHALQSMLSVVYGANNVTVSLGGQYVLQRDVIHFTPTLDAMAEFIYDQTEDMVGGPVQIRRSKGKVEVLDARSPLVATHQLAFTDLMGQPTWLDTGTMTMQLVMRGDLDLNDLVVLPRGPNGQAIPGLPGLVGTQISGMAKLNQQSTFQGIYQITGIRQIGNFRSSDSTQWSTVVHATTQIPTTSPDFSGSGSSLANVA